MDMKKNITLIAMGVGGTLLYQQIKNGNVKRLMKDMMNKKAKICDELEDMM